MPGTIRVWLVALSVAAVAAAVAEAGTTRTVKVSGVTRGSTVAVEATVQCPQGQNQCSQPQASGTLKLTWTDSRAEFEMDQLSPEAKANRWVLRGSIQIDRELPEGKTASGDFALTMNESYAIEKLEVTVRK